MQQNLIVVDDDEVDRYLIARIASKSKLDFRIWEFSNGQAVVDAIENPDPEFAKCLNDDTPSLMLVDINMPGMNGFELIDEVRDAMKQGKVTEGSLAILICSSSEHPLDQESAEKDPLIGGYIVKPPSSDRLEELVENYCS